MTLARDRLPDPQSYFESRGLKLQRGGKWRTAQCPFHGGSDSMRVNLETGGWCCMNCGEHGGDVIAFEMRLMRVGFIAACRVLGAWRDDPQDRRIPPARPLPLPARDALEVLANEAQIAAVSAENIRRGVPLSDDDRQRLRWASARINTIRRAIAP
jgi:hypothetical protein